MELTTIPKAARRLGISERLIRRAVEHGVLPAYRIGERWLRLDCAEVEQWVRDSLIPVAGPNRDAEDVRQLKLMPDGS